MNGDYLYPVPESQWEALLRESPDATIFQTPGWARVLNETYGYLPATRLYDTPDGEVLVPMMEMRRFGLKIISSMPIGYGGFLRHGTGAVTPRKVLTNLVQSRPFRFYLTLPPCTETIVPPGTGFEEYGNDWNNCQFLDLAGGPDAVVARAHRGIRRDFQVSQRRHVEVEAADSINALREFYALYLQRSREWGYATPPHPFRLYEAIQRHLGPHARLLIARHDGGTVGGLMLFTYGRSAFGWMLAVVKASSNVRPGTALIYHAIADTCQEGAEDLNLGGSGRLDGVQTYKRRWGAVEVPVRRYIYRSRLDRLVGRLGRSIPGATEDYQTDAPHSGNAAG